MRVPLLLLRLFVAKEDDDDDRNLNITEER